MTAKLTRRQWLAASLCLPSALAAGPRDWNRPAPLGKSGLKVTPLGLGCGVLDANVYQKAVDAGINYFHCLPYGQETFLELVGKAVKPVRSRVVLACGGNQGNKKDLLEQVEKRLKNLGTDYIDLFYLTSKHKPEAITDELMEALRAAKQAGKIRAGALSTHGLAAIVPRLLEVREVVGAIMIVCNFATWVQAADPNVPPRASLPGGGWEDITKVRKAGIGIVAMKALVGGLQFAPPDRQAWAKSLEGPSRQAALAAALKWVLRNEQVDTAPVAVDDAQQFERNLKTAAEPFTDADKQRLAAAVERISPYYCRMCQRCEGACRSGLPVSDVMRFLMYAEGYGNIERGRREFQRLPQELRAVRCGDCPGCTVRCPNGVRVRERLSRAQTVLA
jgi:predicted aldo/keto reductase-like oxidoreductase